MPRLEGSTLDAEGARNLIAYDRYLVGPKAPLSIKIALSTAPQGFAYKEEFDPDEEHQDIESWQIHDAVRIIWLSTASDSPLQMAWAIGFIEAGWIIRWMKWSEFFEKVEGGDLEFICTKNPQLIVGGLSLASDYMFVLKATCHMPPHPNSFSRTNHPGLNRWNMDRFWANLLKLSVRIPMFPHPQDLLSAACKVVRDTDLTIVASQVTKSPYPRSAILRTPEDLRKSCDNTGVVIKRDFSDSTTCTFLPGSDRSGHVRRKHAETSHLYEGIDAIPTPQWMAQPFNVELAHKGEIRAFVAGGKLRYAIHTWPQGGRINQECVDNYTPLDLLQ